MKREIVINASALEVRVALLEDGSLTELYLERQQHRGLAGNIYKGKVTRVLPGMQAAFVDIGLEKAGFLHVSDFHDDVQAVGSIAEVIGEDDVETYPVDDDGADEAQYAHDLEEAQDSQEVRDSQDQWDLAELEGLEEPPLSSGRILMTGRTLYGRKSYGQSTGKPERGETLSGKTIDRARGRARGPTRDRAGDATSSKVRSKIRRKT